MSARHAEVRIFARWNDDPLEGAFTLDARLDEETRRIVGGWMLFGAIDLDGPRRRPFALDASGQMDFGEGRGADRIWTTNLRAREIAVGAIFEITWPQGDCGAYTIEKIARLGSKGG